MLVRAGIARVVVALLTSAAGLSAVGLSAQPAAAGLVSGDSVPETTFLDTNVEVLPHDTQDVGTIVLTVPVRLQAGQSRRISDQLTVTVPRDAVVQNMVECLDWITGQPVAAAGRPEAHSSGTNYSPSMGRLPMHASLLFTAPYTGLFLCQIRAQTDAGNDLGYRMTAVAAPRPGGTWLTIDNFTDDAPMWWQTDTCNSDGTDPHCIYLGLPPGGGTRHPVSTTLYEHDGWIAPANATKADITGHMQITSCYPGTKSCLGREQGAPGGIHWDRAVFRTHLDFVQLDQRNAPCDVGGTPDTQYTITNDVHHFLVDYGPVTVPVSATCGGSRRFLLHVVVTWVKGNAVKIDAGSVFGFRSATNANVIVRSTLPATTVPKLTGAGEGSVPGLLAAKGLTIGTVTRVADPAPAGTVIAQNSPAGTTEPVSSPVDLTVSLGMVIVPDLQSLAASQAISELTDLGLHARVEQSPRCIDPGQVIDQRPGAGTVVAPGSTVTITIDSGSAHSC